MEVAALSGRRLRIAAKIGTTPAERDYNENVFQPALDGRRVVASSSWASCPARTVTRSSPRATPR